MFAVGNLLFILAVVSQATGQFFWYRNPLYEEESFFEKSTPEYDGSITRFAIFHWPMLLKPGFDSTIPLRLHTVSRTDREPVFEEMRSAESFIPSWLLPLMTKHLGRTKDFYNEEISNRHLWIFRIINMYRAAMEAAVNKAPIASGIGPGFDFPRD